MIMVYGYTTFDFGIAFSFLGKKYIDLGCFVHLSDSAAKPLIGSLISFVFPREHFPFISWYLKKKHGGLIK